MSLDALLLTGVWRGQPPAPPNLKSWQTHDARCWLESVDKLTLAERFTWLCEQLDLWSSRARRQPERKEECRAQMIPLADEAIAIRNVLG